MRILGIGHESGPFYFPTYVAYGQFLTFVNFIIDTGADTSIISYGDAIRMGIDFSKLKDKIIMAGIGGTTQVRFLRDVRIIFQTNDRKNSFYVLYLPQICIVPDPEPRMFPSLLGVDVLRKFSLHFDLKQKLMYLETQDVSEKAITTRTLMTEIDKQDFSKRHSFMSDPNEFVRDLCLYLDNKLRAFFPTRPQQERQVEDEVEKLLMARNYDYLRQGISFEFSNKVYKPDIVFEPEKTVLEIKLCKSHRRGHQIIEEICSDIVAYKSRFEHLIFVVYDLGVIKNPLKFREDIEKSYPNTLVLIVQG